MASQLFIEVRVRPRWWLLIYVQTVFFIAFVFDCDVDEDRFKYWFCRGWNVHYRCGHRWVRIR